MPPRRPASAARKASGPAARPAPGVRQVWVHGHSGTIQSSHGFFVERLGFYLRLKAETPAEVWLHFAPPTPHAEPGTTSLRAVRVRLRTFGQARVTRVHMWDGARRLAAHDGLAVQLDTGDAQLEGGPVGLGFGELRLELSAPAEVESAVGVSMLVTALAELDAIAVAAVGLELSP